MVFSQVDALVQADNYIRENLDNNDRVIVMDIFIDPKKSIRFSKPLYLNF